MLAAQRRLAALAPGCPCDNGWAAAQSGADWPRFCCPTLQARWDDCWLDGGSGLAVV